MDTFYVVILIVSFILAILWILYSEKNEKILRNHIEVSGKYISSLEDFHRSDEKVIQTQNNHIKNLESLVSSQEEFIKMLQAYYGVGDYNWSKSEKEER